ncbi:MAG: sensor histidine kinase [Spirosoma sp.]|nr:sensor histidine kinase [Spirosoma sp.]
MTASDSQSPPSVTELVTYLFTRREAILGNWRITCEQDPTLGKISAFTREEFDNLMPIILNILEDRLLHKPQEESPMLTAHNHGLHRWHKGLTLVETMQELNYLTQILYQEVQTYQTLFPQTDANLLLQVQREIAQVMSEAINGSVQKYDELQRFEAASRAATLQQAIEDMDELTLQRGNMLRSSSHDLRSSFSIISAATHLLKMDGLDDGERDQYIDMLGRNLGNVQSLLSNLMDLSRLESGTETLQIQRVDVGKLLTELVASAQPMASERRLVLQGDGPASLVVETDPVKLQRIAQNLLINALKYTRAGFVSVTWIQEGEYRWLFSVQDSGPGLPSTLAGLMGQQLKPTVEMTSILSPNTAEPVAVHPAEEPKLPAGGQLDQLVKRSSQGEGVGLQIVKRLCDMLKGNMDVETIPNRGTMIRVRMPIHLDS